MVLPVSAILGGVFFEVAGGDSVYHDLVNNILLAVRHGRLEICHMSPHGTARSLLFATLLATITFLRLPAAVTNLAGKREPILSSLTAVVSSSSYKYMFLL